MALERFGKRERRLVAEASEGGPSLGTWLERIRAIGNTHLTTAIEGIWCGSTGSSTIEMPGTTSLLCVGWYHGRVEFSYIS